VLAKNVLTCGNAPLSAAIISERLEAVVVKFRQQIRQMVDSIGAAGVSPTEFQKLTAGLRAASATAALETLVAVVEAADPVESTIGDERGTHRFRGVATKEWLTPFGVAKVSRRYYAGEGPARCLVPLDVLMGMVGRYLTPEVEEMAAFASGAMTPCEVEQFLAKVLPVAPSATAIKRAVCDVGEFLESERVAVETQIVAASPLSKQGAHLVVSWDGVMVPLRGDQETCWKEASVGRVSIYGQPSEVDGKPPLLDSRYFARMPESGMGTLIDQVAASVADVRAQRAFDRVAVICDGKDSIWKVAKERSEFDGAVLILDFYHASKTLSDAADAIFGKETKEARRWHQRRCDQLQLEVGAINNLLRTLRRHEKLIPVGSDGRDVVRRAIAHFKKNRDRMRYADFIAMGLPIGSGHIESAAKNIVQARLKRSGMRWSITGGQHVLNIRTRVKDSRWEAAWAAYLAPRMAA